MRKTKKTSNTLTWKYSLIFSGFSENFVPEKFGFSEVFVVPGRFRKVREACRNHFHLFSSKFIARIPSYDPKTEKFYE